MKKLVSILLTIMMIGALAAGCGKSSEDTKSSDGEKVKLTFWAGLTGDDQHAMADMVKQFNSELDMIEVDFFSVTWGEIFT